jgi:hypothetical protein
MENPGSSGVLNMVSVKGTSKIALGCCKNVVSGRWTVGFTGYLDFFLLRFRLSSFAGLADVKVVTQNSLCSQSRPFTKGFRPNSKNGRRKNP